MLQFIPAALIALTLFCSSGVSHALGVVVEHQPNVKRKDLREIQEDWQRSKTLEALGGFVASRYELNGPLNLVSAECGSANAFYLPERRAIVMCLELVPLLVDQLLKDHGKSTPRERLLEILGGSVAFVYFHEVGHALIHMLGLPVLGREEDAADQISTYLLLNEPRLPTAAIYGALRFFRDRPLFFTQRHMSGEHALNPQRQANIACWAFGSDQQRYNWAVKYASLSQSRAQRCPTEYSQLVRSVETLLSPHLR